MSTKMENKKQKYITLTGGGQPPFAYLPKPPHFS